MPHTDTPTGVPPARTHAEAVELFRRPFAPGAIGFRAMTKVALNGNPYGGAQVAAFINAQSVVQRLNAVVPGHWRQEFAPIASELIPVAPSDNRAPRKLYLVCRLIVTLPDASDGRPVDAVYEDIGEMEAGSYAGLKALYSDARKRAAVAAGIGAYLYTALAPVVLPIGPDVRQVLEITKPGTSKKLLILAPATEQWLRNGYRRRMETTVARRDLGPILAHGEPDDGMGQGESTDHAAQPAGEPPTVEAPTATATAPASNGDGELVNVDFGALGPGAPEAA
jgi:hypothetical protein